MVENMLTYWGSFQLLPMLLSFLLGGLVVWFLRPKPVAGDLTVEGEGRLRAEADELRARLRAVEAERDERVALVTDREAEITDLKGKLAAAAAGAATATATTIAVKSKDEGPKADTKDEDETYALEWRNRYLAARVKYLESRLADAPAPATAAAAGAAVATKAAPKTTKAKPKTKGPVAAAAAKPKAKAKPKPKAKAVPKKAAPKPKAKVGTTTATKASSGAASGPTSKKSMDRYFANVQRYDPDADRDVVERIVKYCGVSLKSRDTSLVACRDQSERDRIVRGFASRKLGIKSKAEREQLVEDVCGQMSAQRQKSRVTFYYLMAQKAGKLDEVFGG